jgi:diguanylate cyclase (GGDEF)-like protein
LTSSLTEIRELHLRLQEQAIRDPLTGLYNRRYLDETLERELSRAKREGYPLSLTMIDLDHFKLVNDTYGHPAGDEVLIALSTLLQSQAREGDIPCRYGGEEFVLVLPRMSLEVASQRAEQWREAFGNMKTRHGEFEIGTASATRRGRKPAPWTTSASISLRVKAWRWSARREQARPVCSSCCCAITKSRRVPFCSMGRTSAS